MSVGYTFRRLAQNIAELPSETCPDIDNVVGIMEDLRKANQELRDAAIWWRDRCEETADERDTFEMRLEDVQRELDRKNSGD